MSVAMMFPVDQADVYFRWKTIFSFGFVKFTTFVASCNKDGFYSADSKQIHMSAKDTVNLIIPRFFFDANAKRSLDEAIT